MTETTVPPRRNGIRFAKIGVSALLAVLLSVFAVSRITQPRQARTAAQTSASVVCAGSGLTTTFVGIGKNAGKSEPPAPATPSNATGGKAAASNGATSVAGAGGTSLDLSFTGASHTDDLIMARQLLMDSNETAMGTVDPAKPATNPDLATMKAAAYQIYTNLSVAPHLFPSNTRPVIGPDGSPTPATAASPKIWDDFNAFYTEFMDAANLAYDLSRATDLVKFQMQATTLRADCDGCHAKNMNVFDPNAAPLK